MAATLRQTLIGLALSPLARPLTYVAWNWDWWHWYHIAGNLQSIDGQKVFAFTWISFGVALPAVGIALWLRRHYRLTPGMVFLAWGWAPLLFGTWIAISMFRSNPQIGSLADQVHFSLNIFGLMVPPIICFALYLAYLRWRDQKRGIEPRG